jgi:hypothetical protein
LIPNPLCENITPAKLVIKDTGKGAKKVVEDSCAASGRGDMLLIGYRSA